MAPEFCEKCEDGINFIFAAKGQKELNHKFVNYSADYVAHSSKGCSFCSRVLIDSQNYGRSLWRFETTFTKSTRGSSHDPFGDVSFHSRMSDGKLSGNSLTKRIGWNMPENKFELKEISDRDVELLESFAGMEDTFSKPVIELCRKWLRECAQHKSCCHSPPKSLPLRLLDVEGATSKIRLCQTDNLEATKVSYMTLSHCWGNPSILESVKLTTDRYDTYLESIDLSALPKTFQEAITVTRSLDCRYLWIDALCIIQNDEEDWLKEGLRMNEVYGSSYLNIAAAWASDSLDGCFSRRNSIVANAIINRTGTKFSRQFYCATEPERLYDRNIVQSRLATRAWVFQERFLAPRTLHFGAEQLFWECSSCLACETYPFGFSRPGPVSTGQWSKAHSRRTVGDRILGDRILLWKSISCAYSQGTLSRQSDQLIALAGVAKNFASENSLHGSQYLAGLWRPGIYTQLGWTAPPGSTRIPNDRIPSWSWLSVDTPPGQPINYDVSLRWPANVLSEDGGRYDIELLKAVVNRAGDDKFGDVTEGFLKIRCTTMVKVKVAKFIGLKNVVVDKVPRPYIAGANHEFAAQFQFDELIRDVGQLFALPIYHKPELFIYNVSWLLLQATGVRGTYRRVGLCYEEFSKSMLAFQRAQKDPGSVASEEDYEEVLEGDEDCGTASEDVFGKMRFVIRIV